VAVVTGAAVTNTALVRAVRRAVLARMRAVGEKRRVGVPPR
jgi:hypothetical protein